MKKFIVNIILLFAVTFTVNGSSIDEMMIEANKLYQESKYDSALTVYKQVTDQGYVSAALYFNIGNSYYRTGEIGRAILNYERGLKLEPSDEDIKYNLRIAQARIVDRIKYVPQIFLVEWWNSLLTFLSVSAWAAVVIIFYISLLIFIGIYFLTKSGRLQRFSFYFGSMNFIALIFIVFLFIARVNRETSKDYGVLITDTISVKVSPDEKAQDAFVIHEGLKFEVEDELQEWARIKLSDGKVGWLNKTALEMI
ncbi:MAG: tetratricopeptide repeat protein [Ignavibacteriae bacterium]|nr:tetratricopeptide repeat protein [Ignavibacteriota bacterium]NOG96891.1 tetratricopeptide repeat protein [Ignavibacteriota bacterium]